MTSHSAPNCLFFAFIPRVINIENEEEVMAADFWGQDVLSNLLPGAAKPKVSTKTCVLVSMSIGI